MVPKKFQKSRVAASPSAVIAAACGTPTAANTPHSSFHSRR